RARLRPRPGLRAPSRRSPSRRSRGMTVAALVAETRTIGAFALTWSDAAPAALVSRTAGTRIGRPTVGLAEIFTAAAQRARTSQAYVRSAVGSRLRVRHVEQTHDGRADGLIVLQRDDVTQLEV